MKRMASFLLALILVSCCISWMQLPALAAETSDIVMLYESESERYWLETVNGVKTLYMWDPEFDESVQTKIELFSGVVDAKVLDDMGLVISVSNQAIYAGETMPTGMTEDSVSVMILGFGIPFEGRMLGLLEEDPGILENMKAIGRKTYAVDSNFEYAVWEDNGKLVLWYLYNKDTVNLGAYESCFSHPDGYFFWTTPKGELQVIDPGAAKPKPVKLGKMKEDSFFQGTHYVAWEDAKGKLNFWPFSVEKPIQIGSAQDAQLSAESIALAANGITQVFKPEDYSSESGGPSLSFETSNRKFWTEAKGDRNILYAQSKVGGEKKIITESLMNARVVDDQVLVLHKDQQDSATLSMLLWTLTREPYLELATYTTPIESFEGAWQIGPCPLPDADDLYYYASKAFSKVNVNIVSKGAYYSNTLFKDHDTIDYHPYGFFYLTGAKAGLSVSAVGEKAISLGKLSENSLKVQESYIAWELKDQVYYWTLGLKKGVKLGPAADVTLFPDSLVLQKKDQLFQAIPSEGGELAEITPEAFQALSKR